MILEKRLPGSANSFIAREYYFIHLTAEPGSEYSRVIIDDACYDILFYREKDGYLTSHNKSQKHVFNSHAVTIHNLEGPYQFLYRGSLSLFTIKFQPWLNGYFFGDMNLSGILDVTDLFDVDAFINQINNDFSPDILFNLADQFIQKFHIEESAKISLVREICQIIYEKNGVVKVNELSNHFEKSRQYLNRVFKQHVLYSLKDFILTVRILSLVKERLKKPELSLTTLSYKYGYADQPHFNRDFKQICGEIPSKFFTNPPEFLLRH